MKRIVTSLCFAALLGSGALAHGADDESAQLQSIVSKISPAVVTVRALLKMQGGAGGQGRDMESRIELHGIVVGTDGLVMISNLPFSPASALGMFGGGPGGEGNEAKATPSDIKVIFEQEDKEYSAFLAATDSKLNLAFIKIEDLSDKKLTIADFSKTNSTTIGQRIISVSRLQKGYDYAPYFETSRINGEIDKPRKAWLIEGKISEFGLPVFDMNGEVIGALTTIQAGAKNESNDQSEMFGMVMRMLTGSGGLLRPFVLPSPVVNALIGQARIKAVAVAAERAKIKTAKPIPVVPKKAAK